ncbi:hypothetical protein V5799_016252 [Amblyomma americanum]|uniref:Uncharacterized protein n=1 Tax=Amblyomma americanum TaxID=6943 RepID=A0AAQ4F5M8_AMBAM
MAGHVTNNLPNHVATHSAAPPAAAPHHVTNHVTTWRWRYRHTEGSKAISAMGTCCLRADLPIGRMPSGNLAALRTCFGAGRGC